MHNNWLLTFCLAKTAMVKIQFAFSWHRDIIGSIKIRREIMATAVTDGNFKKDVLESDIPVLVDFWAEWCGPCKLLGPTLEELSKDLHGKVKVVKMNVDEQPVMPSALGIRGIPTMILFKNGDNIGTKVGNHPKASLLEWVNSLV